MTTKTIIKRVAKFGPKPKTPYQALRQAHDLLQEEGRWVAGSMFDDGDPAEAFKDPASCGNWSACAMGALGLVTGEMPVSVVREPTFTHWKSDDGYNYDWDVDDEFCVSDDQLSFKAAQYLALAMIGNSEVGTVYRWDVKEEPYAVVISYNDHNTTRDRILDFFKDAMKLAKKKTVQEMIIELED